MIEITTQGEVVVFAVRVTPRASRDAIEGEYQGALKVRLTALPTEDRANGALRRLLAESLNVPISTVRILAGARSRTKRISISGVRRENILKLAVTSMKESDSHHGGR